jgi:hypothetical protein
MLVHGELRRHVATIEDKVEFERQRLDQSFLPVGGKWWAPSLSVPFFLLKV